MSGEAKSVIVFGLYLTILGLALVTAPNLVLSLFGFPATRDVWIRVTGTLVVIIGFFCIQAGRFNWSEFYRGSIVTRLWVMTCFSSYVILGLAPRMLLVFGVIDLSGALWTALVLSRADTNPRRFRAPGRSLEETP
jgi:hypothetical protein